MSIKFVCSCGKHLRARDEMAARRSVCPRCGSPVGIPSKQAADTNVTAKPLTPAERLQGRVKSPVTGPISANESNRKAPPSMISHQLAT